MFCRIFFHFVAEEVNQSMTISGESCPPVSPTSQLLGYPVNDGLVPEYELNEEVTASTPCYTDEKFESTNLHETSDRTNEVSSSERTSAADFVLQLGQLLCSLDESSEAYDVDLQLQDFASQFCEGMLEYIRIYIISEGRLLTSFSLVIPNCVMAQIETEDSTFVSSVAFNLFNSLMIKTN
jgi:hypothetical protein